MGAAEGADSTGPEGDCPPAKDGITISAMSRKDKRFMVHKNAWGDIDILVRGKLTGNRVTG